MDSRKSELADFDRLADAAARRETARQSHADRTRTSVGDDGPRCRECREGHPALGDRDLPPLRAAECVQETPAAQDRLTKKC